MPVPIRAFSRAGLRILPFLVATAPVPLAGQGASVLQLLSVEGRQLAVGGEFEGALSSSDYTSPRDNYLEAWSLEGTAGQSVTIDLLSDDFDAYLYVVGPGLAETLSDDDSAGGCNARITFTFLETGTFHVVASSLGERATGTYTIRVTDTPEPALGYACGAPNPEEFLALDPEDRTLRLGDVASGRLAPGAPTVDDGRPAQAWALEGRAGESVTVVLEAGDFDAFLYLVGPGLGEVLTDDDGAGDLNSLLTVTFPEDGTYTVVASSISEGAVGAYTIRVEEPLDPNTVPTDGRSIEVGGEATGTLGGDDPIVLDGRRGQAWALEGRAGEEATIDLVSEDFDCYLYLVGPGLDEPLYDDDGAGDLDSRITVTFPETGTYRIIVSALGSSERGEFTLRVR